MEKTGVIEYFDKLAPEWDSRSAGNDRVINEILDNAEVKEGLDLLDVACGTGVMFPYYGERRVKSICGVDISKGMIKIARAKFPDEKIRLISADATEFEPGELYDRILVYNAFPHFPNPEKLISHLSTLLNEGGILTVAHGMSRQQIDSHHRGSAGRVSVGLVPAEELRRIFEKYLEVTVCEDNDRMYQLCGRKR
jgi:ubiquinone/menaquinone biosynthesis C-methylase UbiE